jgi:hypothetical protein
MLQFPIFQKEIRVLFKKILNRLLFLVQFVAVVLFIVFEEVVWETIAKPIYDYIHELHLLRAVERRLQRANRYVVLILFLVLLLGVEGAGLLAGVMAVRGMVLSATLLYGAKIPIAAFTFWLFHATESKLLSFEWFKWSYEKILSLFAWIKSREIYRDTVAKIRETKASLKRVKQKYFTGDNAAAVRFKRLYRRVRDVIKKEA